MMQRSLLNLGAAAAMGGLCACYGGAQIRSHRAFAQGDDEAAIQAQLGLPDAIREAVGSHGRFYTPHTRPPEYWSRDSQITLYYLSNDLAAVFDKHGFVRLEPISPAMREFIEGVVAEEARP